MAFVELGIAALALLTLLTPVALLRSQTSNPNQVLSVGYIPSAPVVAPGQIVTLFLNNLGVPSALASQYPYPTTLSGISVAVRVLGAMNSSDYPTQLGIIRVSTEPCSPSLPGVSVNAAVALSGGLPGYCPTTEVTVQIPNALVCVIPPSQGLPCANTMAPPFLILNVVSGGVTGPDIALRGVVAFPHLLNSCDRVLGVPAASPPCSDLIAHGDGSLVSGANPAKVGEELVAYAVGEQTYSPVEYLRFTYAVGAIVVPGTFSAQELKSVYAGAVAGFFGLSQINFIVPPMPPGTLGCQLGSPSFQVYTNASITTLQVGGSVLSFCVVP